MWNFWLVTVAKERSAEKLIIEMGGGAVLKEPTWQKVLRCTIKFFLRLFHLRPLESFCKVRFIALLYCLR